MYLSLHIFFCAPVQCCDMGGIEFAIVCLSIRLRPIKYLRVIAASCLSGSPRGHLHTTRHLCTTVGVIHHGAQFSVCFFRNSEVS